MMCCWCLLTCVYSSFVVSICDCVILFFYVKSLLLNPTNMTFVLKLAGHFIYSVSARNTPSRRISIFRSAELRTTWTTSSLLALCPFLNAMAPKHSKPFKTEHALQFGVKFGKRDAVRKKIVSLPWFFSFTSMARKTSV